MSFDARITLTGSLGQDPILAYTSGGVAYCKFSVACAERVKVDGDWTDRDEGPTWFNVTVWRDLAEHVAESLRKGDRATVVGTVTLDVWEKDGEKRSLHTVTADEVAASMRWAQVTVEKKSRPGREEPPAPSAPPTPDDVPF